MIKVFCDCCEKEIKNKDAKWTLQATLSINHTLSKVVSEKVLCATCGEKMGLNKTN